MDTGRHPEALLDAAADVLRAASSVLFVTGAGLSADSGLPTYRGIGGLYVHADTEDGVPIEEALSGAMLRADPAVCWKHLRRIEESCRGARPNRGHVVIAALERRIPRVVVLTQNVDGLHRAAGSTQVIEIHGRVHDLSCTVCARRERVADYARLAPVPRCPECGGLVRPDVVLFGEMLPAAESARLARELERGFDVVCSVGTSSRFPYVAAPVVRARAFGATSIEVNPERTVVSDLVDLRLPLRAADALDRIAARLDAAAAQ